MVNILKRFIIIPLGAALLGIAACSSNGGNCDSGGYECSGSNDGNGTGNTYGQTIGTVAGAVLGSIIGSEIGGGRGTTAAVTLGAVIGAIIGSEAGKAIDEGDLMRSEEVAQKTMDDNPDGETSNWNNPDSGNSGTITPQTTYKNEEGEDCRDFESTMTIDGKTEVAHGRACLQPDGSWKIVN